MSSEEESTPISAGKLRFLEDVPHALQAEVARREIPLKNIMTWKKDTVVEFDKIAGESIELLIGDQLIARGEVVVVNERFGVRISEITHPSEKPGNIKK